MTRALSELETEFLSSKAEEESSKGGKKDRIVKIDEEEHDLNAFESGKNAKVIDTAPVTKIVANILKYAIDGRASDIHIEPMASNIRVRFRVDGVMNTSIVLPSRIHSAVVAESKY